MSYAEGPLGARLYYESHGKGAPIVFAHELGATCRAFDAQVEFFKSEYRCITFNARGYPPSDVPQEVGAYSQAIAADDIGAVMDAADVETAHFIGVSMGSAAILQYALKRPGRFLSMTLASIGTGSDLPIPEFQAQVEGMAKAVDGQSIRATAEMFMNAPSRVALKSKNPALYAKTLEELSRLSPLGFANTMRGVQKGRLPVYAHKDQLTKLAVPTLILYGENDAVVHKPSLFLKDTIPGARIAMIPDAGHGVNLEQPDLVNEFLAKFINENT